MSALVSGGVGTRNVIRYSQLQVSTSQLDIPIQLFWGQRRISPNCIWYNNFQSYKQSPGKGGGKTTGYTYSASVILALGEGVLAAPVNVWGPSSTTTTTTLSALGLAFVSGTASQAPWSYLTTNFPTQALAYMDTAYVASPKMNLGESASVPDYAFEIPRLMGFTDTLTAAGWTNPTTHANTAGTDVSLADVIPDFLTNAVYGMGFSAADIADTTTFRNYQASQGLYFSPLLSSQEKATEVIDRWARLANTWIYWSGTQIQFVPLGDSAISGNGHGYAPDLAPAYALSLNDFLVDGKGGNALEVERQDPADCYNRTVLEICDRTRGYVSSPVEYKDQQLVATYGLRDNSSTQAGDVCNPAVGAICAQLIGKRAAYIRNTYRFKLSYRYIRLLPGSIVTLTEPNIGLDGFPVRIRTIDEDEKGALSILAEELPAGIGTYFTINTPPAVVATTVDTAIDPGPVNTPAVCEPSAAFDQGQAVVLIAASGGPNWGGATVYLSLDGVNFDAIGELTSPALQATLTAALPAFAGANPDTTDTLSLDATQSDGTFPGVAPVNAQSATSLCWLSPQPASSGGDDVLATAGELLAFGAVAATGTFTANLSYLYRGLYGTSGIAHNTGDQFTLFDVTGSPGSTLKFSLPASYIGKTLYLKFQSFNIFGNAAEDLSGVATYAYTPTGASYGTGAGGVPSIPAGFGGIVQSSQVILSWSANQAADNVASYAVWRANGTGANFSSAAQIWAGNALTFTDTNVDLVTGYSYFLVAINAIGDSLPTPGFNATTAGINDGQVLQQGQFSGVSEAAIDFNPQVLACGLIEITLWDVENSANGDVTMVYRVAGSDVSSVTYFFAGNGANGNGSTGISGSGSDLPVLTNLAPGFPGTAFLRINIDGPNPIVQTTAAGKTPTDFNQNVLSGRVETALSGNPTGLSFKPNSGTFSLNYTIKGYSNL